MRIVLFFLALIFLGFVSCNKEKSFEVGAPATGSLRNDATGECLLKTAAGAFIAGTALSDSNYLEVEVDVTTEGAYNIRTDTVNGYSFSGIGNFTNTGINKIRLAASGTPTAAGTNEFTVIFDTTFCFVPVTVLPAGSDSGPASFTLQGNGDTCIVARVDGQYMQGVALNSTNTTSIKVNVTKPGTYTISTNSMNGFQFSGSGTLPAPGEHLITLVATGTPEIESPTVFTITADSTTCSFTVVVTAGDTTQPEPATGDLFPLSANSWWSYVFDVTAPEDSFTVFEVGTKDMDGQTYHLLQYKDVDGAPYDTGYFRKNGPDYFMYGVYDSSNIPGLEGPVSAEILFLRDNPATGDTWTNEGDVEINGIDAKIRLVYTCTAANITETVNGKSFSNVYKISIKQQIVMAGVTTDVGTGETWYARGTGLIYHKGSSDNTGDVEWFIKNSDVK